jgi:DNA-nicking Smr family endonuclease
MTAKRPLRPEELKLWATVLRTVRPARGRAMPKLEDLPVAVAPPAVAAKEKPRVVIPTAQLPSLRPKPAPPRAEVESIEPGRKRRIARERDDIEARIDLHGMGQFEAEDRLKAFLLRAQDHGVRAVLVITGKGTRGDGVIRRRAPDWFIDPILRDVVAGVSPAHRRHGGEGALYVALKRKRPV